MLEASGFDYRNRHPQKYLLKLARKSELDKDVIRNAYKMMLDLYRTFAPLKLTSSAMAMACLELTTRLMDKQLENVRGEKAPNRERCEVHRQQIMEAMLDLLDLYTHFQKSSTIGPTYNMDSFIKVRITLNQEAEERKLPRFAEWRDTKTNGFKSSIKTPKTPITPKSPTEVRVNGRDVVSPATLSPRSSGSGRKGIGARGQDGTVRFMLDGAQAKAEKAAVSEYYKTEYEDVEIEVDEPAPPEREEPYMRNGPRADSRSEGTRNENRNGRHNRDDRRDHHGSRHFKRQRHR
jgi:CTD kinase subunit beta